MKFHRRFNRIYAKSSAANSDMVTVELLTSYCFPFMLYGVEALSLSSANVTSKLDKNERLDTEEV